MIVHLMDSQVVISGETDAEQAVLASWSGRREGRLFRLAVLEGSSIRLDDAGEEAALRFAPINITFDTTAMPLQLISNLAPTPFELDRRRYASIEGFWQGLKLPDEVDRQRIAALSGHAAKAAGPSSRPGDSIVYEGREICVGTVDHWALMERACEAKFNQHDAACAALLSTGSRSLEHKVAADSRTIPGVVMADIWMRLRARLASA